MTRCSAAAGAAVMAGAVKQLRAQNPDTVFAAAGDLIGASTFESFILNDKPTIDALNEAGLEVSSVGNHEFDQGYDDLVNRVMAPYDADDQPRWWCRVGVPRRRTCGSRRTTTRRCRATWTKDFGDVKVGFVGAVTEHLPELVGPGRDRGHQGHRHRRGGRTRPPTTSRPTAPTSWCMLVHEGAPMTNCAAIGALAPTTDFGSIVQGSTRTWTRSCRVTPTWRTTAPSRCRGGHGRPVTERPVVSAGQYGTALNQIVFTVDTATGEVAGRRARRC